MDKIDQLYSIIEKKHKRQLLARAYYFTSCWETAKDIFQMACLRVYTSLEDGRIEAKDEFDLQKLISKNIFWSAEDYRKKWNTGRQVSDPLFGNSTMLSYSDKKIAEDYDPFDHEASLLERLSSRAENANLTAKEKLVLRETLLGKPPRDIMKEFDIPRTKLRNYKHKLIKKLQASVPKNQKKGKE